MSSFEDSNKSNQSDSAWGKSEGVSAVKAAPAQRPRLKLAPRTKPVGASAASSGGQSSIFGGARSREEILASKGIDVKAKEKEIEEKARVLKLTKDQEEEAEACRAELAYAEKELREANEKELPVKDLPDKVEKKKKELSDLLTKFGELNIKKAEEMEKEVKGKLKEGKPRFERPSERRKRQEKRRRRKRREEAEEEENRGMQIWGPTPCCR